MADKQIVRFGIVGLGNMGSNHARTFMAGGIRDAALTAVCDLRGERLGWARENVPDVRTFERASDMFASGAIDAVILAAPHYSHPPLAIEAFAHKIHVMCEKPAGVYGKQVAEMNRAAAAARKDGIVFGLMFNQRTNSLFKKMREMAQGGELGRLRRNNWLAANWYRSQLYYDSGEWRATWAGEGGGVLLNQSPHNLDLWQWICGMPKRIMAFCHEGKWHDIEVEDDVTAYAEYEDGSTGVFVASTGDPAGDNRFAITGDRGKLVFEDGGLTFCKLRVPEPEFNRTNTQPFKSPPFDRIAVETDGSDPEHAGVLQAFTDCILGRGELVARGEEGANGVMISNAMHLSSWLGRPVELPVDEDLYYDMLQKKVRAARGKTGVRKRVREAVVEDMRDSFNV
ncbi:MAG: Gfo/Idh/MocA family oxidoreductase [Clostridiales bacterium]|nr:Gfo/Idh/MocA family oxidoreductase [Clostridiales bacterium]